MTPLPLTQYQWEGPPWALNSLSDRPIWGTSFLKTSSDLEMICQDDHFSTKENAILE